MPLISRCEGRKYPLIMVTSGHHMPPDSWTILDEDIKITGIHMTICAEEVYTLAESRSAIEKKDVEEMFKESSVFGRVNGMLMGFRSKSNLESVIQRIKVDYGKIDMNLLKVLFSRIFLNFTMGISFEDAKANDMFMTVADFEKYQAHMITYKDTCDSDINGFIHQLVPIFPGEDPQKVQPAFKNYDMQEVLFYIGQDKHFYDFCSYMPRSKKDIYNGALNLFQNAQKSEGSLKGQCFELLIRLSCEINKCGLQPGPSHLYEFPESRVLQGSYQADGVQ